MASREIRYIGSAWQVQQLPDGSKELIFNDPDGVTFHVLPLPKAMAEACAAQLRGEESKAVVMDPLPPTDNPSPGGYRIPRGEEPFAGEDTILPDEPYPPEALCSCGHILAAHTISGTLTGTCRHCHCVWFNRE